MIRVYKILYALAIDIVVPKITMDKILQGIYKNFMQEIEEDKISCTLKKEVLHLLGDSKSYPDQQTYEKYRDIAFRAAEAGEEAGFYRGFRYAMQLFMECR